MITDLLAVAYRDATTIGDVLIGFFAVSFVTTILMGVSIFVEKIKHGWPDDKDENKTSAEETLSEFIKRTEKKRDEK